MAWRGETENFLHGISHQGICPLLKPWRQVAKGKATVQSAGLREAMVEYLRAAVSAEPKVSTMAEGRAWRRHQRALEAGAKRHSDDLKQGPLRTA